MADAKETLCNYQKGEERGVWLLRQLQTFTPTTEIAAEIGEQIVDEMKHDRLFSTRLKDLEIDCMGMHNSLEKVYDLAQTCVDRKDWVESITIQAVIEELAMSTFTEHYDSQDAETQVVLDEIIKDEARHLRFGIRELKKVAKGNEEKVRKIHLEVMEIVLGTFKAATMTNRERGILAKTISKAYKMHKQRLAVIGVELPEVKEAVFA